MTVTERPAALKDTALDLLVAEARSDWVRLRTLLVLRWLAIGGQTVAVVIASFYLGLRVELGLCFLAIGASVVSNLVAMAVFPENQRLSDRDAMLTLLFDLAQLGFLLFLTGGLNNPFALLILAPVTISATALTLSSTIYLGLIAIGLVTALGFTYLPLVTDAGTVLELPPIFVAGFWCAIVIGIVFLSGYARRVAQESHSMSQALAATQMALAREQKLTDLGGVVAAAAHELGTPLATIKLVSTELVDELDHRADLQEDARLIRDQANRCRDILQSMGRAGKDDLHLRSAPLAAVLREAAEPHAERGVDILYSVGADVPDAEPPIVLRLPEVIHGMRNLIQNAVDFAEQQIWIEAFWTDAEIRVRVIDDGAGFPSDMIGRLGDPFLRRRRSETSGQRPGYVGMGLGLFIAKTLLERSGAQIEFDNASDPFLADDDRTEKRGAVVTVTWPSELITVPGALAGGPLGENQPITS